MKKIYIMLIILSTAINIYGKPFDIKEGDNKYNVRFTYGKGYYSNLGEIFLLDLQDYDQKSEIFGISGERYIYKDLFNKKLDISLQAGFIYHKQRILDIDKANSLVNIDNPSSLRGKDTYQLNLALRFYYKDFPWNDYVRTRISVAEGISYSFNYLDIELSDMNNGDTTSKSKFLNYIELNIGFNMGDIFKVKSLDDSYIGIGISHRSGIYGLINNVSGGSNFVTMFIATDF